MTDRCNDLDLFFDRELAAEAADAFRDHLVTCTRCQDTLEGRMLEAALLIGERARHNSHPPSPHTPLPPAPLFTRAADGNAATEKPVADQACETKATERAVSLPAEPEAIRGTPVDQVVELTSARRKRSRRLPMTLVASAGSLAAAAASLMMISAHGVAPTMPAATLLSQALTGMQDVQLVATLRPERPVEGRFSAPTLDHYRRFLVVRGADPTPKEQINLQDLYALEARHDMNTLVGARAMIGDLSSAARTAQALPRTAGTLSDLAAIELMQAAGRPTRAEQEVGLHRALSLASDALRVEPQHPQAKWNRALALRELDLPLVAERVFGEVAARGEPGWSQEARANQQRMHDARSTWERWNQHKRDARAMALGGPVPENYDSANPSERIPSSLMRDELYLAIATASTRDRLDRLAPVARTLDDLFATRELAALVERVRRSELGVRAPIAAALVAAMRSEAPRAQLAEVRTRAITAGALDIAIATFLVPRPGKLDVADLAQLDQLVGNQRDPWWQLFQLERSAYVDEYVRHDYAAVDERARRAAPICASLHAGSCGRITRIAGSAAGSMGRIDDGLRQLADARQRARDARLLDDESAAIYAIGQLMSARLTDELDSSAVADAYLEEAEQRNDTCDMRLQRLDFEASAALRYHRFAGARDARQRADDLEGGACADSALRFNGETVRAQLALHHPDADQLARMQAHLARLRKDWTDNFRLWLDYLGAIEQLLVDPDAGTRTLRALIRTATDGPSRPFAPMVRGMAFDVLVDAAATAGHGNEVLALLAERLHASDDTTCVVGVASWNRLVVASRDVSGKVMLETREIPAGQLRIPAAEVVSRAMRDRLAGCPRIQVVTHGLYFGSPGLLDDDVPWAYRSGGAPLATTALPARELVVSDVVPPEQLRLPVLRSFGAAAGGESLQGMAATPDRVLDRMTDASLIVIVSHGFTDVSEPSAASLVLSPSPSGDYLLTAPKVQAAKLTNAPTVVLAGCDAGRVQVTNEPWSLATSFLRAGARTVIAPTEPIPDDSANEVFRSLVDRLRAGADAVDVLAAERRNRGQSASWLSSIVVFVR